jgi:formylglycine-generating enzyme required for sulfatase activity
VPGGTVKMGKENLEGDFYGWDNESGSEVFSLPDYEVSQKLASNEEYLEFMQDGAYEE